MIAVKVKKGKVGYYGHRRLRREAQFRILDATHFSPVWMELLYPEDLPLVEEGLRKAKKLAEEKHKAKALSKAEPVIQVYKKESVDLSREPSPSELAQNAQQDTKMSGGSSPTPPALEVESASKAKAKGKAGEMQKGPLD